MSTPTKLTPERKEEVIRKWVRATPAERKLLCKEYGISESLPGYWRRNNQWPKDLVVPPPRPAPAPTLPGIEGPSAASTRALTEEQKIDLSRRFMALPSVERDVFAKTVGVARTTLYKWAKGASLAAVGRPRSASPEASTGTSVPKGPDERERKAKIALVEKYLAEGMGVDAAVGKAEITKDKYYRWRRGVDAVVASSGAMLSGSREKRVYLSAAQKLEVVAKIDELRAKGLDVPDAAASIGLKNASKYHLWKRGKALGIPGSRSLVPAPARARKADVLAVSNRALQKANGGPRLSSPVGSLVKRFVQELAAMGAEIQELKTTGDGHCTVIVRTTETFEL